MNTCQFDSLRFWALLEQGDIQGAATLARQVHDLGCITRQNIDTIRLTPLPRALRPMRCWSRTVPTVTAMSHWHWMRTGSRNCLTCGGVSGWRRASTSLRWCSRATASDCW